MTNHDQGRPAQGQGRPTSPAEPGDDANDAPEELAHLADLVEGQGDVTWCGCGEPITEYDGEWLHVYNPALTGADDHDAHP